MQAAQAMLNSVFSLTVINRQAYRMNNIHVVQTLPAPLIEFPHYCIIALKMALGYVNLWCEYALYYTS